MKQSTPCKRQFASDNYAGICPEAFAALTEANHGHARSYGNDPWTEKAANLIREIFETDCEVFFVFNGTAANSLALASMCQSYNSILCHQTAHIETAECGAPEFFSNGSKVLLLPGENGKIDPDAIKDAAHKRTDIHYPKPRVLSLTQATETGTLYSLKELGVLSGMAKKFGLRIQMDGARFANAMAAFNIAPSKVTWKAGVDVLCFGGTKNGLPIGEAVVFFNKELAHEFDYRCKQAGQLASKMRFLAAPWVGMLQDGAWLRHATHANAMAKLFEAGLRKIPGVKISYPCETNCVFARLVPKMITGLRRKGWQFYTHVSADDCRLMCSWDTQRADVEDFLDDLRGC